MNRILRLLPILGCFAVPAIAQDNGVPAGVLIFDAGSAPSVAPPTVVAPPVQATTFALTPAPSPLTQSPASVRSSIIQPSVVQPIINGAILDPATVAPLVDLAPGETISQVIAASPAIVQVPNPQPVYTSRYEPSPAAARIPPPPKRDPVTGRLRDTPGWTGRREAPASIGCFPAGACAVLNAR